MPGSPPTRVAEPWTSPPPVTRSNSPMPEICRSSRSGAPDRAWKSILRPPLATLWGEVSPSGSSTMVFQPPQPSHLPVQRPWTVPQLWQTKRDRGLAI